VLDEVYFALCKPVESFIIDTCERNVTIIQLENNDSSYIRYRSRPDQHA